MVKHATNNENHNVGDMPFFWESGIVNLRMNSPWPSSLKMDLQTNPRPQPKPNLSWLVNKKA